VRVLSHSAIAALQVCVCAVCKLTTELDEDVHVLLAGGVMVNLTYSIAMGFTLHCF